MSNVKKLMMTAAAGGVPIEYLGYKTTDIYGETGTTHTLSLSGTLSGGTGGNTIQEDDLVLVTLSIATGQLYTLSFNTSGYTQLFNIYGNSWDNDNQFFGGYKIMGSTPDSSVVINLSQPSYRAYWQHVLTAHAFRYVDQTTPMDTSAVTDVENASTSPPIQSITTVTKNAMVVCCVANAFNNGTMAVLLWSGGSGTYGEYGMSDFANGGSFQDTYMAAGFKIIETPGSETPSGLTELNGLGSGNSATAVTLALRPADP
jgi:hypothetical protein